MGYGLYGKLPVLQTRVVIAKGGREERPIQWKVTGASDARGNCKGRKRGTANTMESYR